MKGKRLLVALLSISAFCMNAHADDVFKDVTNTYLTNADFEGDYSVYSNPSADRAIYQPSGWTVSYTSGDPNDMTSLNSNCSSWNNFSGKAQLADGGANTYWIRMRWGTGAILRLSQEVTLPIGKYTISAAYYKNGTGGDGFIFVGSTEKNANGNEDVWKTLSIDFESDGFTATTIGCYAKHTNAYEKFLAFDNFVLQWNLTQSLSLMISKAQDFLNEDPSNTNLESAIADANNKVNSTDAEELESAYNNLASVISLLDSHKNWLEAKETAQQAIDNASYDNVTGNERTTLSGEIAKDEPTTADDYRTAIEALNNATAAFKAAKDAYDALATAKTDAAAYTIDAWPYASNAKKTALDNAVSATATTAADANTKANDIVKAYRQFVESNGLAEGVTGSVNMTSSLTYSDAAEKDGWSGIGTNQGEGDTDGDGHVASKYFDGGWSNNAGANIDVTQEVTLPAGKYLLQITARGSDALNTYTLSVGDVSVDLPRISSSGGTFGRGWSDKYIIFESDGTPTTIAITANSTDYYQWVSFNRLRLIRLELYTEMATTEDYAALAAALETAEAKTLGFDEGEYAPYNNVAALQALAAAKAINPQVENEKAGVVNATEALNNATWTANTAEVNAIYDGQFANTEANTTSGDIILPGWTKVNGIRLLVKDEATDPGLAYTDGKAAVFSWGGTTLTYGEEQTGYTLPLNAGEVYELSFKISGWRDGDYANVLTVALDGQAQTINPNVPGKIDQAEGNPFAEVKFYLTPSEDVDNSILTIYANHHFAIADLKMVKATLTTIDKDVKLAAGKYATRIYPFTPQPIDGINFYSCAAADGNTLTLVPVETPQACVPYILGNDAEEATEAISVEQTGVDIHLNDTYTEGYLTGVFAATTVPVGSYVLQTLNGKQAFYKVEGEFTINTPYRAYLTKDSNVKAFYLGGDDATAINALDALTSGAYEGIYSVDGVKLNRIEKGVNILKMADGTTRKVIVK